jgi:hypothetical protein
MFALADQAVRRHEMDCEGRRRRGLCRSLRRPRDPRSFLPEGRQDLQGLRDGPGWVLLRTQRGLHEWRRWTSARRWRCTALVRLGVGGGGGASRDPHANEFPGKVLFRAYGEEALEGKGWFAFNHLILNFFASEPKNKRKKDGILVLFYYSYPFRKISEN